MRILDSLATVKIVVARKIVDHVHIDGTLHKQTRLFHDLVHRGLCHHSAKFAKRNRRATCHGTDIASGNAHVNILHIDTARKFRGVHRLLQSLDGRFEFLRVVFPERRISNSQDANLASVFALTDEDADFRASDVETDDDSARIDSVDVFLFFYHHSTSTA